MIAANRGGDPLKLSKEKQQILQMPDAEVRRLLRLTQGDRSPAPASPAAPAQKEDIQKTLQGIVGLEEAKQVLKQIVAYHRLQTEANQRGIALKNRSCHMCFAGNPGTAKTSFARVCAKVFQMEGICSRNVFHEVGRADLVASYSGQTAPRVKKAIRDAAGGVLFIDEAYSLLEDKEGGYGDEAIAALVQELDNCRDVIVIFAGYPDKMAEFLSRNPGLRSRIPFVVRFPDYSCEELLKIARHIAQRGGFRLDPGAESAIESIVKRDLGKPEFGNGRYIRNLVEAAQMNRACSLVYGTDLSGVSDAELFVLRAEDFKRPAGIVAGGSRKPIGFSPA